MSKSRTGSGDTPLTPASPGAWDTRSEEVLTETAAAQESGTKRRKTPRRGAVDPVKALLHRHRDLCQRAVDPLEIAAGLEAHGVTDRTAARFRHRDVFSLAEEMYARVPRDGEPRVLAPPTVSVSVPVATGWGAVAMVPGAVCALAVTAVYLTGGQARIVAALLGALAVAGALRLALRYGPLRASGRTVAATRVWTWWLVAYALLGDGLVSSALDGGPHGDWNLGTASVLALALAVVPAAVIARLFAVGAGRRLALSRGLEDFAAAVRPLLFGLLTLFIAALVGLLLVAGRVLGQEVAPAGAGALGTLLLLARLLTVYGSPNAPARALGVACAVEALALASAFAGRLPGGAALAVPVETLVARLGPAAIPALACGAAALVLLAHSARTLTHASAHAGAGEQR